MLQVSACFPRTVAMSPSGPELTCQTIRCMSALGDHAEIATLAAAGNEHNAVSDQPPLNPEYVWAPDMGFDAMNAIALKAAISGSILADPEVCFVMMMALPSGPTGALATAHDVKV